MKRGTRWRNPLRSSAAWSAALVCLALLGLWVAWKWSAKDVAPRAIAPAQDSSPGRHDPTVADPRLTFATPYRNVRPDVKYVGDDACAVCHPRLSTTYHSHPMGRSLSPIASAVAVERYDAGAHNPFVAGGFRYAIDRRGPHVVHKETALDATGTEIAEMQTAEVHFTVGSAERGRSYLIDRDGYLFASPISWYPQKGIWDLSPGYRQRNPHFSRPIGPDCLFCHANQVEHVEDTANRYLLPLFRGAAIGCERCHGPGELHVRRYQNNEDVPGMDDTIVNPRHLEYELREAVCQQCHLQGEQRVLRHGRKYFDYRPGLPLQLFLVDFVKPAAHQGDTKFVGTVEQMVASRCFQESRGPDKMGCISCHDPHKRPAVEKKIAYYRARCLDCHTERNCSLPRAVRLEKNKDDSCIACHMPRTGSDVNHTSITDHRILRRPEATAQEPSANAWPQTGPMPLVPFHRAEASNPENARDLGIALMDLAERQPSPIARQLSERALPLLESALTTAAADAPAWEAKGSALWFQGRPHEALAAFESALRHAPERETSLFLAASLALRLKQHQAARSYAERAIRVNPWRWQYHQTLAAVHAQDEDWGAAIQECREALKLDPTGLATRRLLVTCYLRTKDAPAARADFDVLLRLCPPQQQEELRRWFEKQAR